jgi:fructose-specific component phosphotransferase system IIB-like protein
VDIVVERETAKLKASMNNTLAETMTDDDLVMAIGEDLIKDADAKGKKITWPKGKTAEDDREAITDYPAAIVKDAKARWKAMSASDRETYKQQKQDEIRYAINEASAAFAAEAKNEVFAGSFGLFDIVFGMLALLTAYKIGADEGD